MGRHSKLEKPESAIDAYSYGPIAECEIVASIICNVTSTTPEHTFSILKSLKNYLRSTMNGLVTNINESEEITEAEFIHQVFSAKSHKREITSYY